MNKTPVIQRALHKSGLYLKKYSPVALSCVASVGVIVTVVTAIKATPKAVELVKADSRKNHDGDPYAYTKKEAFMSAWKCYIPTAAFGLSTIACIMGANALNSRKQAALTSAYALINQSYKEYKDKLEITPQEIYRWSDENRTTPKTAAPSIEDAMNIIEKYQNVGYQKPVKRLFDVHIKYARLQRFRTDIP